MTRPKRHDQDELLALIKPHEAVRLPPWYATDHGRVDIIPHAEVPEGVAYVLNVSEAERRMKATRLDIFGDERA